MEPIDYKAMLIKYIDHVSTCEGTDFLNDLSWTQLFNAAEEAELKRLANWKAYDPVAPSENLIRPEIYSEKLKNALLTELSASAEARPHLKGLQEPVG